MFEFNYELFRSISCGTLSDNILRFRDEKRYRYTSNNNLFIL